MSRHQRGAKGVIGQTIEAATINELRQRAETAELERDELRARLSAATNRVDGLDQRLGELMRQRDEALRERDEYLRAFSAARATAHAMEQERDDAERERDDLRAQLAALSPDVAVALARQANALREEQP